MSGGTAPRPTGHSCRFDRIDWRLRKVIMERNGTELPAGGATLHQNAACTPRIVFPPAKAAYVETWLCRDGRPNRKGGGGGGGGGVARCGLTCSPGPALLV
jgi:hypothetical protein